MLYRKAKAEPRWRFYSLYGELYRPDLLSGKVEVVDADLSSYFDLIPHRELLRLVAGRVSDGSVLRLIKAWLRAPNVDTHVCRLGRLQDIGGHHRPVLGECPWTVARAAVP